ncbi:hypothetical protein HYX01_00600 [Candidatus Woesearchaeota archaeon]|nr:hypothetical protein [Candidatus Woesearchaeota archaeon]
MGEIVIFSKWLDNIKMTIGQGVDALLYQVAPKGYKQYRELHNLLYNISTEVIQKRKVPEPSQISAVFGTDALATYYLMHALLHSQEYNQRGVVVGYARRDRKAVQRHSFDSAARPLYRLYDRSLPSRYLLTAREMQGVLVHDLGEEFGKGIFGALVINDIIRHLFGSEIGRDAEILTSNNMLIWDSVERKLKESNAQSLEDAIHIIERRARSYTSLKDEPLNRVLSKHYKRVLDALSQFSDYVSTLEYLGKESDGEHSEQQKKILVRIIEEMHESISKKIKEGRTIRLENAKASTIKYHNNALRVIKELTAEQISSIDDRFIMPEDSKLLIGIKNALYRDYIFAIASESIGLMCSYREQGIKDDIYLSPFMEKLADCTDTARNMDPTPLQNAVSIFNKAEILIVAGIKLAEYLKGESVDNKRLLTGVNYMFKNLQFKVYSHLESATKNLDTASEQDLRVFEAMKDKTARLREIVDAAVYGSEPRGILKLLKRIAAIGKR